MKILIINGSPKGENSITLQSSKYLEILHPEHSFSYLTIGASPKKFEKDFSSAKEAIEEADLLIFSYPVYTFIVPSQLHRFIELIKENNINLSGKFATQISTSKHFYDVTAHGFIRDNCHDLGLGYIKGLSADMEDLATEKGMAELESFFDYLIYSVKNGLVENAPKPSAMPKHNPASSCDALPETKEGEIVIVADLSEEDSQLSGMVERFRKRAGRKTKLVNIREFEFKGGCVSCFNCAVDGTCIYKDGFSELLRDNIQKSDAIVIAFSIKDHSMGSLFKTYDDRQFCNGHRTVTMGMPFGYIVSGNLEDEENLRMIIEARADVGGNFLCGVAGDEADTDLEIDNLIKKLDYAIEKKFVMPQSFLGIGGMKIFRDLIWQMQGMMRADHKFYKAHGQYDFPQKHFGKMLMMYPVGAMIGNKKIKAKIGNKMNEGMLMPYMKSLESAKKRMEK